MKPIFSASERRSETDYFGVTGETVSIRAAGNRKFQLPLDGVAYGLQIETSHATVQGVRMCGMPIIEHPREGAIHRLYAIGRIERTLEDLEVKQCMFTGDEVTNPNHLALLINGRDPDYPEVFLSLFQQLRLSNAL